MSKPGTTDRAERVHVEHGLKRVRAYLGGQVVADTAHPRLVWEVPYYPAYYFPAEDVRTELLAPTSTITHSPSRGDAQHFTIKAGGKEVEDAALAVCGLPGSGAPRSHPPGLGRDGRVVRGGRGGLHASSGSVHAGRHPGHVTPSAG